MPKIFAFYLPQFHRVIENDRWWGEGFTEWTNVKNANSLFPGHIQPIHPLDNNYYNLMDLQTVLNQTALMKKYGIDGFVYYHYYFTGKLLLEKPAENLLANKNIEQNYFFCWANHDWIKRDNGKKIILMKQEYGDYKDWNNHFEYLLPFFKDSRYEKISNCPILMFFNGGFSEKKEMIDFFDKKCKENGFSGIYIIESFCFTNKLERKKVERTIWNVEKTNYNIKYFIREPDVSHALYDSHFYNCFVYKCRKKLISLLFSLFKRKYVYSIDGNKLYYRMKYEPYNDNYIHSLFFSWDNTPRHGRNGYVITPPSKENVIHMLNRLKDDEYIILNAWNEWAEGMILEPSEEYGLCYLEWIKEWKDKISFL